MDKICFCIPTTSRNRSDPNKELELITSLRKLNKSLLAKQQNLSIIIGYDNDDPYYSLDFNREYFNKEFQNLNIMWEEQKVEKGNVVEIWNNLVKRANELKYKYFMVIGDDIDYPENSEWINNFVKKLKSTNDIGISGGDSGNPYLPMTQFMISYKHFELFNFVFNPMLKNWFCDNYLLELYPKKYTHYDENVKVLNIGGKPRYQPENHQRLYKSLIKRDKPKLLKFINKNKYDD